VITGVHVLIDSAEARRLRAFFRDVLGFPFVDAGDGWLIFALPPAELGVHPADEGGAHELSLMCDDIRATLEELGAKGVEVTRQISDEGFGLVARIAVPGGELTLYEPRHPTPPRTQP
jgi:catechol 2,3-dioxygenase-like lactoylglutathione lyase family enzyme